MEAAPIARQMNATEPSPVDGSETSDMTIVCASIDVSAIPIIMHRSERPTMMKALVAALYPSGLPMAIMANRVTSSPSQKNRSSIRWSASTAPLTRPSVSVK